MPEPVTRQEGPAAMRAALLAGAAAGLGVWCTRGELERVAAGVDTVRVALLPPLWLAAICLVGLALVALGIAAGVAWRGSGRAVPSAADAEVTRPLYAGLAMALPYLPYLPDWWPALTVLAGPFAMVVWAGIAVLTVRAGLERLAATGRGIALPVRRAPLAIAAAAVLLYGTAALRLTGTSIFPGGDEPHYLVVAQSLWRDGDLRIENNHRRGDTFEYFPRPLEPHYLVRGVDREIYSIHPVGLPVAIAPIYAASGYYGVVAFVTLCAIGAGVLLWTIARRLTSGHAATVGWLAAAASAPFVFNSFTIYPEIPAALAAIAAYALILRPNGLVAHAGAALACGVLLGTLPWLSSKYSLMVAVLGLAAAARVWWSDLPATMARRLRVLVVLTVPVAASVAGWMAFHAIVWGSPMPGVVYGRQRPMRWEYFVSGAPGLLFDQEYGVVAAAPILLAAAVGLGAMFARGGPARRVAMEITLVFVALLVPVGAFHIWWGGTAAVGRPLIAALLFLGLPIAWLYEHSAARPAVRAACWLLIAGGVAKVVVLAFVQQGLLLVGERNGVSRLLEYWSPTWDLPALAPAFITQPPALALACAGMWIAGIAVGLLLLRRVGPGRPGTAGLAAFGATAAALAAVTVAIPLLPGRSQPGKLDLLERAQSTLLHDFDATARPHGVIYSPLRLVDPARVPPMIQFAVGPRARPERTTPPLLHNARWSLPAGRYRLEIATSGGRPLRGELGAQVGRAGPLYQRWTVDAASRWGETLTLPVDARFFGLVASGELAAQPLRVSIRPLDIVDASKRRRGLDVIQSWRFGQVAAFFHDDESAPEPAGFWILGDSETQFAIVAPPEPRAVLRLRAGASAVSLRVRADGVTRHLRLAAGASEELPLAPAAGVHHVEVAAAGGFVPAKVDPASTDTRFLGCWVEIAG